MSFFSWFKKKSTNTGTGVPSQNIPVDIEAVRHKEKTESKSIDSQTVERTLIHEEVVSALDIPQIVEAVPEKSVFEKCNFNMIRKRNSLLFIRREKPSYFRACC